MGGEFSASWNHSSNSVTRGTEASAGSWETRPEPRSVLETLVIKSPQPTDEKLIIEPDLPPGFSLRIHCGDDRELIARDGKIKFTDRFTATSVRLEVIRESDGKSAVGEPRQILVPAAVGERRREVDHPYQSLRYGLFIHWVAGDNRTGDGAGLVKPDGSSSHGVDMYCNEMNLDKVVADVAGSGFEVVFVTDFHGLGTTLHPSDSVDHWRGSDRFTAKRDLIGELIRKLKARGIRTVLFTHPLDGHDFPKDQQDRLGWNDPGGGFKRWNDFLNDVYGDIVSRYGNDIAGLGFDGAWGSQSHENIKGKPKVDMVRLRNTIKLYAPALPLISLSPPNKTTDLYIREVWRPYWFNWDAFPKISRVFTGPGRRGEEPKFDPADYNTDLWPSYNRPPAVVIDEHWTVVSKRDRNRLRLDAREMFRYTVLQHGVSYNGPAVLWAVSPYVTGDWPMNVREQFLEVAKFMAPIRESLTGTYPSTSFVTPEGESIRTIPNGFVATRSRDNRHEYIHVLRPPKARVLRLGKPADGRQFEAVGEVLTDGTKVTLSKDASGYSLTLGGQTSWNETDTVIKLTAHNPPMENLALFKSIAGFSSSDEAEGCSNNPFWHSGVTDGFQAKAWSSLDRVADNNPQWITIDLLKSSRISRVVLYPYDWEYSTDFSIEVSPDNKAFVEVGKYRNQETADGRQVCCFPATEARYVRVKCTKVRSKPRLPLVIKKASYGVPGHDLDVTGLIRIKAAENRAFKTGFSLFRKDPAPSVPKRLLVIYSLDGKEHSISLAEGGTFPRLGESTGRFRLQEVEVYE